MKLTDWLVDSWYRRSPARWLLSPLSGLYRLIVSIRRLAYQHGWLTSEALPVPVIVVGNLTVGGSGKTPFVIALVAQLKQAGYRPGIISRGYGSQAPNYPYAVSADSNPILAGDEPTLLARHTACPVVIDPHRIRAGQYLLEQYHCDVIVADDGLQHYALQRDIEILIIDARRQLGNGFCLPAGPLREPASRISVVDFVVWHGEQGTADYTLQLSLEQAIQLNTGRTQALQDWQGHTVHAVAGIGHPPRFFNQLQALGLNLIPHAFADHHAFTAADLQFDEPYPILMTEKDAVKCQVFATDQMWSVPATPIVSAALWPILLEKLRTAHG